MGGVLSFCLKKHKYVYQVYILFFSTIMVGVGILIF